MIYNIHKGGIKQMIEPKYYVYVWRTKYNNEVFYVGKGSGNRWNSMKDRNSHFKNIRKKYECECEIIKRFYNEEDAYNYELELGTYYKSIGQARACHVLGNINRYFDEETLRKMHKTTFKKNSVPWNKGKKMDKEFCANCRERMLGKKQIEETRRKRSKSLKGHSVSTETRSAIANARKKKCYKIDTETMEVLKTYDSMSDVADELGVSLSIICIKCKQFPKEYKGYYWRKD